MIDPTDRPERPGYGAMHSAPAEMSAPSRRRPILAWLIAAIAVAFAIGLLANPWFERNVRSRLPGMRSTAGDVAAQQTIVALQARIDSLEARAGAHPQPALNDPVASAKIEGVEEAQQSVEARVASLQAELAELRGRTDSSVAAATEGAERAQTALLVSALRRAVEQGNRLDAYEPALRARFGASHPNEVSALLSLGRRPVEGGLLASQLTRALPTVERVEARDRSWWQSFKSGLAGVVAVRRADTTAADPQSQLRFAAQRAQAGDVDDALRAVAQLPPSQRQALSGWTAEARRYAAGLNALATLETAALNRAPAPAVSPTTL